MVRAPLVVSEAPSSSVMAPFTWRRPRSALLLVFAVASAKKARVPSIVRLPPYAIVAIWPEANWNREASARLTLPVSTPRFPKPAADLTSSTPAIPRLASPSRLMLPALAIEPATTIGAWLDESKAERPIVRIPVTASRPFVVNLLPATPRKALSIEAVPAIVSECVVIDAPSCMISPPVLAIVSGPDNALFAWIAAPDAT